ALLDLQAQAGVERLLARAADPEVAQPGLAHLDHSLFHGAGADHDAVQLNTVVRGQRLLAAKDLLLGQRGQTVLLEAFGPVRHAASLRDGSDGVRNVRVFRAVLVLSGVGSPTRPRGFSSWRRVGAPSIQPKGASITILARRAVKGEPPRRPPLPRGTRG